MSKLASVDRLAVIFRFLAALLASTAGLAAAQPTTAVFVHGFRANGSTWSAASQALAADLVIGTYNPTLPEGDRFADQAYDLNLYNWTNAVLIGHSNGGLVSREASRAGSFAGIITVGTLHGGVKVATELDDIQSTAQRLVNEFGYIEFVDAVIGSESHWSYVALLSFFATGVVNFALEYIFDSLHGKSVLEDMAPGSQFLNSLNDQTNLSREASMVRVGIVVSADDNFYGGPFRLTSPAGTAGGQMQATVQMGYEIGAQALDNMLTIDWSSWNAWLEVGAAYSALDISSTLASMPEQWCYWIGAYDGSTCAPSDAIVPAASQVYPGAFMEQISGPSHTEETHDAFVYNVIRSSLVTRFSVPIR